MITGIIIAKNEEKRIKQALASLKFCTQRIVIDNGSTDNTSQAASNLGAKVYTIDDHENFSRLRNAGLKRANTEWVVFLDADERLPKRSQREISNAITTKGQRINGFLLRRIDTFLGKTLRHGETSRVKLLRVGRRTKGEWHRPVHEVWKVEGEIGELKNPILHNAHESIESFLESINTYSSIEARYRLKIDKKAGIIETLFFPAGKFLDNYFLRLGFLDNFPGLIMAFMMSLHSFAVRVKSRGKS